MYRKYLEKNFPDLLRNRCTQDYSNSNGDEQMNTTLAGTTDKVERTDNIAVEAKNDKASTSVVTTQEDKTKTLVKSKEQQRKELQDLAKQAEDLKNLIIQTQKALVTKQSVQGAVASGNVQVKIPNQAKIVRIFTSSTFTDTKYERNSWMVHAYPKIKYHCQQRGYEFQVVDMRWGIRNQATDDHMTAELCLNELKLCQKVSTGPNFVTLFSHKYGYQSLSRMIDQEEFDAILEAVTDENEKALLRKWYVLDENAVPPQYLLKQISQNIPDFTSSDQEKAKFGKERWWKENAKIMDIIYQGAKGAFGEQGAKKYIISVTEKEIEIGLLNVKEPNNTCYWFRKKFDDIENQEHNYQLSRYIECIGDEEKWKKARELNKDLQQRMEEKLDKNNISDYSLKWTEKGVDPSNPEHKNYLQTIAQDFEHEMIHAIDKAIDLREKDKNSKVEEDSQEYLQHIVFCQEKLEGVLGREEIKQQVKKYILGDSKEPLIIHGESGCGKTSIMALAALEAFEWIGMNGQVILRFLGTTKESSSLTPLLRSIINQIRKYFKISPTESQNLKVLVKELKTSLYFFALKKKKVVVFLDSIDQLNPLNDARIVSTWLPKKFLSSIKIIISTLDDEAFGVFPSIKDMSSESNFISVPKLDNADSESIINKWLRRDNRKLTPQQKQYVLSSFADCPLPIYLKLSYETAKQWTSFQPLDLCCLQDTVRKAIEKLFQDLEAKHGTTFVSRALGYVTAAQHGLSENELEDIIACDDDVLNDVYQFWTPPVRRLPPLLIIRLRTDLGHYLVNSGDSGIQVMNWYHRQFAEAAKDRYVSSPEITIVLHKALAEFFSGIWAGDVAKPFRDQNGDGKSIRYVLDQPNKYGDKINERKMKNLPYHQIKAGFLTELKDECLCNVEFLLNKLTCLPLEDLLNDFKMAIETFPSEKDLQIISDTLNLSSAALLYDAKLLISQLLDRLNGEKNMDAILDQCRNSGYPYVITQPYLLTKPGGQLIWHLAGHATNVNSLQMSQNPDGNVLAVTGTYGGEIKIWDIKEGKTIKTMKEIPLEGQIRLANNGKAIVCHLKNKITAFSMTGETMYSIDIDGKNSYNTILGVGGKNQSIIVVFVNKVVLHVDASSGKIIEEVQIPAQFLIYNPQSYDSEHLIAFTLKNDEEFGFYDLIRKEFSGPVRPPIGRDSDINIIAISSDETQIFACAEGGKLFIYERNTLQLMRTWKLFEKYTIPNQIHEREGLLYFSNNELVYIANLRNNEIKEHFMHPTSIEDVQTTDMRTFVTIATDTIVRVWDIEKESNMKAVMEDFFIRYVLPMNNTRYVTLIREDRSPKHIETVSVIDIYDIMEKKNVRRANFDTYINDVALLDDKRLLIATKARTYNIVDLLSMKMTVTFQGLAAEVLAVMTTFKEGQEMITQTRGRRHIKCYDTYNGKVKWIIKCSTKDRPLLIEEITTSKDNETVICRTESEEANIYSFIVCNANKKEVVKMFGKPEIKSIGLSHFGLDLLASKCGNYIISSGTKVGSHNDGIFVWNIKNDVGKLYFDEEDYRKNKEQGNKYMTCHEMVVADDDTVVSSWDDGAIRFWNFKTEELIRRLKGHRDLPDIFCSIGGPYFVSYCDLDEENLIRVWSTTTWECIASYKCEAPVDRLTLLKDGRSFIAFRKNNPVHFTIQGTDISTNIANEQCLYSNSEVDLSISLTEDLSNLEENDPDSDEDETSDDDSDLDDDDDIDDDKNEIED